MKTYDRYKPSGIDWIGDIPEHWEVRKFGRKVQIQEGPGIMAADFRSEGVPLIRISGVKTDFASLDGCNFLDQEMVEKKWKRFKLELSDLLISCSASTDLVSEVGGDTVGGIAYTGIIRLKPNDDIERNFLKFFIKSYSYQQEVELLKAGSTIQHYGPTHLKTFSILLPTLPEQSAIAKYLDEKTAQIDKLIAGKQRLIRLLKEERLVVINQAVTRGINPNAKLKPSGIDWLGDIPEHWKVKKLKYLTMMISKGTTPSTIGESVSKSGEVRFIKAENIINNSLSKYPEFYIDENTNQILQRSILKENDVLIVIAGATIGKVAVLTNEFLPTNTNQAVCFIRLQEKSPEFIWYWLQSDFIKQVIYLASVQAAQPNLSMERIGNFDVLLPPNIEQKQIVQFIETATGKIDSTVSKIEKEIEYLKEYRTALISEVVTGKIKVV